jgi:hypothetical protein
MEILSEILMIENSPKQIEGLPVGEYANNATSQTVKTLWEKVGKKLIKIRRGRLYERKATKRI